MSKRMYHPCHKLSVPSAKLFWCRHCMQMFEDAITRWKHSKQCRGNVGFKQKDQDGQVIQMYVKPDKVCYTTNLSPGQSITYKPQVKKTAADLKCVICHAKFSCLDDMREHVKYPCHRYKIASDSEDSDSEKHRENPTTLKIRRVESLDSEISTNTSTALAVLAEASKHVESLAHNQSCVSHTGAYKQGVVTYSEQSVEVTPIYPQLQNFEELDNQVVQQQEIVITSDRPFIRQDLEPVVIFIQAEDGQDIPEASLDTVTIQSCVKETAETLPLGQLLEIRINIQDKKVKNFVVGCNGSIHPVQDADIQQFQYREQAAGRAGVPAKSELTESQLALQTHQDPDLEQVLHSNIESQEAGNIVKQEPLFVESNGKNLGEIRNQTNIEHSYQLTQDTSSQSGLGEGRYQLTQDTSSQSGLGEGRYQDLAQVNHTQEATFQAHDLPHLSAAQQIEHSSNQTNTLQVVSQVTIGQRHPYTLQKVPGNRIVVSEDNQGEVQVIEVAQISAGTTEGAVTIDNNADLLNNLVYPYTENVSPTS